MEPLKLTFVQQEMRKYLAEVSLAMAEAIDKKRIKDTMTLRNSIASHVQALGDSSVNGELFFAEYGRFVDMGVNKFHPLGGIEGLTETITKKKPLKPRKFYSPIAYGKLNGLMGALLYGYTEETIAQLKKELQHANP